MNDSEEQSDPHLKIAGTEKTADPPYLAEDIDLRRIRVCDSAELPFEQMNLVAGRVVSQTVQCGAMTAVLMKLVDEEAVFVEDELRSRIASLLEALRLAMDELVADALFEVSRGYAELRKPKQIDRPVMLSPRAQQAYETASAIFTKIFAGDAKIDATRAGTAQQCPACHIGGECIIDDGMSPSRYGHIILVSGDDVVVYGRDSTAEENRLLLAKRRQILRLTGRLTVAQIDALTDTLLKGSLIGETIRDHGKSGQVLLAKDDFVIATSPMASYPPPLLLMSVGEATIDRRYARNDAAKVRQIVELMRSESDEIETKVEAAAAAGADRHSKKD